MSENPRITEAESEVMKLLWQEQPLSAGDIISRLSQDMQWTQQTIKTFLNRLHTKKAIAFQKAGRNYLYYPLITHEQYLKMENRTFLDRVYNGAVGALCAQFIQEAPLSEAEIEELRELLERKKNL
ncbi:BlaI/MecI/CopY family transcriptional regulator [Paenibacillus sp. CAU 1782]